MSKQKILIVDDSGTSVMMEQLILRQGPYELIVARDGVEAVQMATSEQPDLILLDAVMPNMDGFEACQKIRDSEATQAIPVIMVTTKGDEESVEKGYKMGCTDYLTKPINSLELLSKVKSALGG